MCSKEIKQVNFSIDKRLYEKLKALAEKEGRSITSQLNRILEEKVNAAA